MNSAIQRAALSFEYNYCAMTKYTFALGMYRPCVLLSIENLPLTVTLTLLCTTTLKALVQKVKQFSRGHEKSWVRVKFQRRIADGNECSK